MKLDLSKYISEGQGRRAHNDDYQIKRVEQQYTVEPEFDVFKTGFSEYEVTHKEPIVLTITRTGNNKLHIGGDVSLAINIPCDRCLEAVNYPIDFELSIDLDFNEDKNSEYMEETSFLDGHIIDIDEMLYPEIFINLPTKVLCRDDCKGICRVCGKNLNQGECGCDTFVADPRMAAISDIFKNFSNN